jgi:hypothetical protein
MTDAEQMIRLRQQLSADPAWAGYFRGTDHCLAGDYDGALAIFAESLNAFIARNDATGIEQVRTAIRDAQWAKGLMNEVKG